MPFRYRIDVARRVILQVAEGVVTEDEVAAAIQRLYREPSYDPAFRALCNVTGVVEARVSAGFLRLLAKQAPYPTSTRRAFVVKGDGAYGLGRMYETYSELAGKLSVVVFRSLPEALAWLNQGVPEAEKVDERCFDLLAADPGDARQVVSHPAP